MHILNSITENAMIFLILIEKYSIFLRLEIIYI